MLESTWTMVCTVARLRVINLSYRAGRTQPFMWLASRRELMSSAVIRPMKIPCSRKLRRSQSDSDVSSGYTSRIEGSSLLDVSE